MLPPVLFLLALTRVQSRDLNDTRHLEPQKRDSTVLWRHTGFQAGSHMLDDFKPQNLWGEEALSVVPNPTGGTDHVLRVHYAKGSYSQTHDRDRGAAFASHVTSSRTAMTLSYDIFFSSNFDFVHGGKLPGLYGGILSCTGHRHSEDCFTTRFVWKEQGMGEVYAYIPSQQAPGFCERKDVHCNFGAGHALGRGYWTFDRNRWHNLAQHVHLNTPGHADAVIKVYLDGQQVYEGRGLVLRTKHTVKIDGIRFSTFFGGNSPDVASTHSCYTYFKNFVLSTEQPVIIG